jgi:hypothetical protein
VFSVPPMRRFVPPARIRPAIRIGFWSLIG